VTITYLFKKILYALGVLWGIITLVFLLFNVLPGDPARLTLGQRTDMASVENVRKELNLDKPVTTRYWYYLNDISPLSINSNNNEQAIKYQPIASIKISDNLSLFIKKPYLGRSYQTKRPVWDILADALPGTIILASCAMAVATFFGILLGVISALKKDTWMDTSSIMLSVMGISTPSFFAGLLIAYILGYVLSDITGLSMMGSLWEYDPFGGKYLAIKNLILPAITLGIRPLAIITQLTRSALLDVLSQDYIRTGYAKGLSQKQVIWRHALPNTLNPVVTAISGWMAELLAGSFFVEFVFSWKGVGKLTVDALDRFDFPVVMGAILISSSIFLIINVLTDIIYTKIDPRITL
jgi:peptide/nickel transport system permease protein